LGNRGLFALVKGDARHSRGRVAAALLLCVLAVSPAAARDVIRDVPYGPDPRQRIDVYLPDRPSNAPVIFMVHGGGWAIGSKSNRSVVENKAGHWLPKGYIFISAGYRLLPGAGPLVQVADVAAALALAQRKAASWGGNPDRFVLMGHSAGAHLVTLLSADPSYAKQAGVRPWLATVPLDSAAYDVDALMRRWHLPLYDRAFGSDPSFWQAASPTLRLQGKPPPMLMVCSSRRQTSCSQAEGFAKKARSMGGRADILPVPLSHREINKDLGQKSDYTDAVDRFLHSLGLP
jgi:arylformamidase